ncbi:MAG: hypothetical protein ABIG68_03325, partial [Acidobacteriota bacterium]
IWMSRKTGWTSNHQAEVMTQHKRLILEERETVLHISDVPGASWDAWTLRERWAKKFKKRQATKLKETTRAAGSARNP